MRGTPWAAALVAALVATAPLVGCSGGAGTASGPTTSPTTSPATSASTSAATGTGPGPEAAGLFDQGSLHEFRITLAPEALARLDADPAAEEYVEGSLTFDGAAVGTVGVRYKGSIGAFAGCVTGTDWTHPSGAKACTKLSIKLKVNWADPEAELLGARHVLLHSMNLDPTMLHERLGYWLFGAMGVTAPRSNHARVVVNDGFVGVFALTEDVDGRFTRHRFGDGAGNLYKEVWPFDASGRARAAAEMLMGLETNEDDAPTAEVISTFAAEVAAAPDGTVADVVARWADLDALLRLFVVDRAIRNDDGPLHWYCFGQCAPHNFFWYEDPTGRTVALIPWDLDNAFDNYVVGNRTGIVTAIADEWGSVTNDCRPFPYGPASLQQRSAACDPLIAALATRTADYDRIRAELVAGPLSAAAIDPLIDAWVAQIEPSVAEAARLHADAPSVEAWKAAVTALRDALATARAGPGR